MTIPDRWTGAVPLTTVANPTLSCTALKACTAITQLFGFRYVVSVRYTVRIVFDLSRRADRYDTQGTGKNQKEKIETDWCRNAAKRVVVLDTPDGRWRWPTVRRRRATERANVRRGRPSRARALIRPSSVRRRWCVRSTAAPVASMWPRDEHGTPPRPVGPLHWPRVRPRVQIKATAAAHGHILVLGERRDLWSSSEPALLTPATEICPCPAPWCVAAQFLDVPLLYKGPIKPVTGGMSVDVENGVCCPSFREKFHTVTPTSCRNDNVRKQKYLESLTNLVFKSIRPSPHNPVSQLV